MAALGGGSPRGGARGVKEFGDASPTGAESVAHWERSDEEEGGDEAFSVSSSITEDEYVVSQEEDVVVVNDEEEEKGEAEEEEEEEEKEERDDKEENRGDGARQDIRSPLSCCSRMAAVVRRVRSSEKN